MPDSNRRPSRLKAKCRQEGNRKPHFTKLCRFFKGSSHQKAITDKAVSATVHGQNTDIGTAENQCPTMCLSVSSTSAVSPFDRVISVINTRSGLGVYLRQYKPRTVWKFPKREIALCIALSPPDHVFQTGVGCLRGLGSLRAAIICENISRSRCRWSNKTRFPRHVVTLSPFSA